MMKEMFRKNLRIIVVIAFFVLLIIGVFALRPAIIGFSVYDQITASNKSLKEYKGNLQELKEDLNDSENELSSCQQSSEKLEQDIGDYSGKLAECNTNIENTKNYINELEKKLLVADTGLSSCQDKNSEIVTSAKDSSDKLTACQNELNSVGVNKEEIEKLKKDIELLKNNYDELAQKTANNMCCKERVDNPSIKYYDVLNNKVICLVDGTKEVSCG